MVRPAASIIAIDNILFRFLYHRVGKHLGTKNLVIACV